MTQRRFSGILAAILLAATVTGCNVKGLFQSYEDEPHWEDPAGTSSAVADGTGKQTSGPGASVYNRVCASCHQGSGKGLPGSYPPLDGSALAQSADASVPVRIVIHGLKGKITRDGKEYDGAMPPWGSLTDQEIADVLTYVRTSWSNKASEVKVEEVAGIRTKAAGQAGQYTEGELAKPL
ncbi:MAG: cytochrome c [Bacteroidota bacterium]